MLSVRVRDAVREEWCPGLYSVIVEFRRCTIIHAFRDGKRATPRALSRRARYPTPISRLQRMRGRRSRVR